jgi:hypothetical protein
VIVGSVIVERGDELDQALAHRFTYGGGAGGGIKLGQDAEFLR